MWNSSLESPSDSDEVKNEMKMEGTKREDFYALATKGEAGSPWML